MYYKLAYQNRPLASSTLILGVGLIVVCLLIVFLVFTGRQAPSKSIEKSSISRFDVVSVTANSVSLYWRTQEEIIPSVSYSKNKSNGYIKIMDVRDSQDLQSPRRNHLITIDNATPSTSYFIKIDGVRTASSTGPFIVEVKTASNQGESSSHPIYGKLIDATEKPLDNAIVLTKFEGAFPIMTLSKNDGTFLASSCCVTDAKTFQNKPITDSDQVTVEVIDEEGNQLIVHDLVSNTTPFGAPLALLNGSRTIDNRVKDIKNEPTGPLSPILGATSNMSDEVFTIIYPTRGSIVPLGSPLLKGTGIAGSTVRLSLDKTKFATSTTVDERGVWQGLFPQKLRAGAYELVATSTDDNGKPITLRRTFIIAKSGEQVLGSATGSATITPTQNPTPTPTGSIVIVPTTVFATATPSMPIVGNFNMSLNILIAIILIVAGAGIILIF